MPPPAAYAADITPIRLAPRYAADFVCRCRCCLRFRRRLLLYAVFPMPPLILRRYFDAAEIAFMLPLIDVYCLRCRRYADAAAVFAAAAALPAPLPPLRCRLYAATLDVLRCHAIIRQRAMDAAACRCCCRYASCCCFCASASYAIQVRCRHMPCHAFADAADMLLLR